MKLNLIAAAAGLTLTASAAFADEVTQAFSFSSSYLLRMYGLFASISRRRSIVLSIGYRFPVKVARRR